jgi:hypothetical protein
MAEAIIWGNKQAAVNDDRRTQRDDTMWAWDEMCCALAGHRWLLLLRMMWDVGWIFAICDLTDEPVCAPNGRNTVPFA